MSAHRGKLDEILERKRGEIDSMRDLRSRRRSWARSFRRTEGAPLRLIAEVKFKSPSAGELSRAMDAVSRAVAYERAGASMVSVLCDEQFFGGGWEDLMSVRRVTTLPLLAKEFILDEIQLDLAFRCAAESVLLIARILSRVQLVELAKKARDRGIEPLVEVVSEAELETAMAADAVLIGVNARDLDTLAIDPERAARVIDAIPKDRIAIHFSGIKTEGDVRAIAKTRADAALVGEALMRRDDPTELLSELVRAAAEP
jgi:indole-3-glycerol phosphate synthase